MEPDNRSTRREFVQAAGLGAAALARPGPLAALHAGHEARAARSPTTSSQS